MDLPPLVRSLVDACVDAAAVVDRGLEVVYFNESYLRMYGVRRREMAQIRQPGMCHAHFGLESCESGCISARAFASGRASRVDEVPAARLQVRVQLLAFPVLDEHGEVYAVIEQYRDVAAESQMQENYRRMLDAERAQKKLLADEVERQTLALAASNTSLRAALEEVSRLALTDGLTGLHNRRSFDAELASRVEAAGRGGRGLALVLFDLDHFKRVNDRYGHPAGDQTLREFAEVLRSSAREEDLVARIGGEEFALIISGTSLRAADRVAERVQEGVRTGQLLTTASGGIALWPSAGVAQPALMRSADQALYAAKAAGRNRILHYRDLPADGPPQDAVRPSPTQASPPPGGSSVAR